MFFISWGAHGALSQVGESEALHCSHCETETHWSTMVSYTVRHVYWLFRWTTDRTLYRMCGNCLGTEYLPDEAVGPQAVKAAIPFMDRRGWTIGAGIIASIFGLGSIAVAQDASDNHAFLQAPRSGDVYEVDLARMLAKPEAPVMYSAMRVVKVHPEAVEVELADLFYSDRRGVERDMRERKTRYPGYYRPERAVFARASLDRMHAEGVILDVER
jgi:hypothetical protein